MSTTPATPALSFKHARKEIDAPPSSAFDTDSIEIRNKDFKAITILSC